MKLLVLASAALLALALPADEVAFAPEAGAELTKTFGFEAQLDVTSQSMSFDGQEMGGAEVDQSHTLTRRVVVTDRYGAVADGRPVELHRSFDELRTQGKSSFGAEDLEGEEQSSELEGEGVVFLLDAEDSEYSVKWDEGSDADDELLAGLREDMDLRALLPSGAIEPGAEWGLEPEALRDVLLPGGDLAIGRVEEAELPGHEGGIMIRMPEPPQDLSVWMQELDGEVTATYAGTIEEEGLRLAVIELELQLECAADLAEWLTEFGGMEYESADSLLTLEGEATLRFDLAAGRFYDFELEADAEVTFEAETTIEHPRGSMDLAFSQTMAGTVKLSAAVGKE